MKEVIEIRFHGRGGQGAKTAAALLAEAALEQGKYVQSFPEYGAERQGAPVRAFVRISSKPITLHTSIANPDVVVIVDPTLVNIPKLSEGVRDDGVLIVNTTASLDEVRAKTGAKCRILLVDATKISIEELGKPVTNMAMLGALEKATGLVDFELLKSYTISYFTKKLGKDIAQRNLSALERAYREALS